MKNKIFGLDIGATTIKAVWFDHEEKDYFLNAVLALPTPEKGMQSESPIDQEEMADAIRKIVHDGNISVRGVNIALPETQVYTRVIEMPPLSDKELSSAIYWEAEQYIPVSLDVITLDYRILRRPDQTNNATHMDVLLVGAPTRLIEKYEQILGLAGLTVASVETEILSAIRSVTAASQFPTSIIVNIGAISTSLAIIYEGLLMFTYTVPVGGMAISRAIAIDFGFSFSQAEEYKKTYGLSGEGKIGKTTEAIVFSIVEEVKKAIVFFNRKYPNNQVAQIVLSGGSALLPGIEEFFTSNTGIETVPAHPWNILSTQENLPAEIISGAASYAIAVGLAMRDYE